MNRPIRKVAIAIAVLFVALFVNLNVVQVVKGSQYRDSANNRRVLLNEYSSPRGQIVVGGSAVAQAVAGQVGLDSASVAESSALGGTALTVGKRITPKLYVSYGMALSGTGQVVTVTYALRRWLSAQFESGIEQRLKLEATFDRD